MLQNCYARPHSHYVLCRWYPSEYHEKVILTYTAVGPRPHFWFQHIKHMIGKMKLTWSKRNYVCSIVSYGSSGVYVGITSSSYPDGYN